MESLVGLRNAWLTPSGEIISEHEDYMDLVHWFLCGVVTSNNPPTQIQTSVIRAWCYVNER